MDDRSPSGPRDPGFPPLAGTSNGSGGAKKSDRLPPPMFPPGARPQRPASAVATPLIEGGIPEDAFILPDEPIQTRARRDLEDEEEPGLNALGDALISPDAPIVRREQPRTPDDFEAVLRGDNVIDMDDVVVTGIGDDDHMDDADHIAVEALDPALGELIRVIEKLADGLRTKGEAGLRTLPEMSRFEATLRGYCVGYLAGARERYDA